MSFPAGLLHNVHRVRDFRSGPHRARQILLLVRHRPGMRGAGLPLFGRVIGVIDEPGLQLLALKLGPHALLIRFFGAVRRVDLRLDQEYLRSEP